VFFNRLQRFVQRLVGLCVRRDLLLRRQRGGFTERADRRVDCGVAGRAGRCGTRRLGHSRLAFDRLAFDRLTFDRRTFDRLTFESRGFDRCRFERLGLRGGLGGSA
jgi:hypothetical protein